MAALSGPYRSRGIFTGKPYLLYSPAGTINETEVLNITLHQNPFFDHFNRHCSLWLTPLSWLFIVRLILTFPATGGEGVLRPGWCPRQPES